MSRTNPRKKKRRRANNTLLMYCEGLGEEIFLKHLRSMYSKNSGTAVTIRNGKGGNSLNIVVSAINEPGDFNRRIVILDNDTGEQEMKKTRTRANRLGIELVENHPCLEATLLSILRLNNVFSNETSAWCKREFESNYIEKKKRRDPAEYRKIFTKDLLDNQRTNISELDILISFM